MDPEVIFAIQLVMGALVLAIYAYKRFGTPTTHRCTTTAVRYHSAALLYYLLALSLYIFLSFSPQLCQVLVQHFGDETTKASTEKLSNQLQNLSPPLLAVIFITSILPNIPGIKHLDEQIRRLFKRMALIPIEVRRLSKLLYESPYELDGESRFRVREHLSDRGFLGVIIHEQDLRCWQLWVKMSCIRTGLDVWAKDRRYGEFLDHFAGEYSAIVKSYDSQLFDVLEFFKNDHAVQINRPEGFEDPMAGYRKLVLHQLEGACQQMCDFIAKGILQCNKTEWGRQNSISTLGFKMDVKISPITKNEMVLLYIFLIFPISIISLIFFQGLAYSQSQRSPFLFVVVIPLIHCLATYSAVFVRNSRPDRGPERHGRPYWSYFLAGALAAFATVPIVFFVWAILLGDPGKSFNAMLDRPQILLLPFTTAFATGFNIDNPDFKWARGRQRVAEGIGQGIVHLTVTFLMVSLAGVEPLTSEMKNVIDNMIKVLGVPLPMLLISFIVGAVIGAFLPHIVRSHAAKMAQQEGQRESTLRQIQGPALKVSAGG